MHLTHNIITFAIICLEIIVSIGDAGAVEPASLPKAVIDQATHVFSPAIAGVDVVHHFIIGNQGNGPLTIVGVQGG
jgi:hypothetical protein